IAAGCVAGRVSSRYPGLRTTHHSGVGLSEDGCEPTLGCRRCQRLHALLAALAHRFGPLGPTIDCTDAGCTVAYGNAGHALAGMYAEPECGMAAQGDAAECCAFDVEGIHDSQHVVAQHVEGIGSGRDGALAVTTRVVAHNSVCRGK